MVIPALRHALCPVPGLTALIQAAQGGEIELDEPPRKRAPQHAALGALLREWILG